MSKLLLHAKRQACGHAYFDHKREDLGEILTVGTHHATVEVVTQDDECIFCKVEKSRAKKEPECVAGRHDHQLVTDRIRDNVVGTGGWDLCFRCRREHCRAARYTTYGLEPLYVTDADGNVLFESPRSQPGGDLWERE